MSCSSPLILLVGMQRSGTRLVSSLLQALGVPLPGPLIQGDQHNPEGNDKHHDLTALQEQLLINLNRWWPSSRGVLPLPSGWQDNPCTLQARERLKSLLATELSGQAGPWAIEDPRTSLLLPLWRQVAEELALPLRLVLSVREPDDVVISLIKRDALAAGMTAQRGRQLWWRHNRQVLLDSADCPLLVVHYGAWFDPEAARGQLTRLAAFCGQERIPEPQLAAALARIRPEHRRSLSPSPTAEPLPERLRWLNSEFDQLSQLCARPHHGHQDPLERLRSRLQAEEMASPDGGVSPLQRLRQRVGRRLMSQGRARQMAAADHPWRAAALVCAGAGGEAAEAQLRHWERHGLSEADLKTIREAPAHLFPEPPLLADAPPLWPSPCCVVAPTLGLRDWRVQLWLQHCPLPQCFEPIESGCESGGNQETMPAIGLHLQPLPSGEASQSLLDLARLDQVLDPDPARVHLLLRLGIRARRLTASGVQAGHGWLERDDDLSTAEARLGLPNPAGLVAAQAGAAVLCLGSTGPAWEQALQSPLWCLPGFDQLVIETMEDARLLASWLQSARRQGLRLVRLNPSANDRAADLPQALALRPADGEIAAPGLEFFSAPIQPRELLEELTWRALGCPEPAACLTPKPPATILWQSERGGEQPSASVCVSLYNYGERILEALEGVRRQEHHALELIVVDDASRDRGPARVTRWMEEHGVRFSRCRLLAHTHNGGLAAARNTAFAAATAPWCFVLDADNSLAPGAVSSCLQLAMVASERTAVVHPLIARQGEGADASAARQGLCGVNSWQRQILQGGNQIDAMALIRRSAWETVGGYTHIEGGWEDYDFWCKLIDAGFHGVICPQVLATYRSHSQSMTSTTTRQGLRRLSRVLQQRHPWLELPWASLDVQQQVD